MKEVKAYLSHEKLCKLLNVQEKSSIYGPEFIFQPGDGNWLLTAKVFVSEKEAIEAIDKGDYE